MLVAESLANHLCKRSRFVAKNFRVPPPNQEPVAFAESLAAIARDEAVDLLIPTCEEVFWVARGMSLIAPHTEILASQLAILRMLHSKWEFIQNLDTLGFLTPQTWLLTSLADLDRLRASGEADFKLVLKPVFSRFAAKVTFVSPGEPTPGVAISPEHPWVAQAFIAGRQLCTYGVARQGRLVAHAVYGADFTAGQGASIHFVGGDHPEVLAWVSRLVAAIGFTGQLAFDFIQDARGQLFPLECNPRATSGVHLFTAADRLDRAFFGETDDVLVPRPDASAMLGLAMLVYGLPAVRSVARLGHWARAFATSRDVLWRRDDPAPFIDQFRAFSDFVACSRRHGVSVLEASTLDIEWNGQA